VEEIPHRIFVVYGGVLQLIFTMLGEKVTTEISQQEQPDTFHQNKNVAQRGGKVAGNARKETERELGRSVVSKDNYLEHPASHTAQRPIEHEDE